MALNDTEREQVREITGERSLAYVSQLASTLTAEQETRTRADITEWEAVRSKHTKLQGGRLGIDVDNERKRNAIRDRVRTRLGLPSFNNSVFRTRSVTNSPVF